MATLWWRDTTMHENRLVGSNPIFELKGKLGLKAEGRRADIIFSSVTKSVRPHAHGVLLQFSANNS